MGAVIELATEHIIENKEILEFITADSIECQFNSLKNISTELMRCNPDSLQIDGCIEFLITVFLECPMRHPVKCFVARLLSKCKPYHQHFEDFIVKRLQLRLMLIHKYENEDYESTVTILNSCGENFTIGSKALKRCNVDIMLYLSTILKSCMEQLINNMNFSPTERSEVYILVHSTCKAMLTNIQKHSDENSIKGLNELNQINNSLLWFSKYSDLPMDTRSICAIVLMTIFKLQHGEKVWVSVLEKCADTKQDFKEDKLVDFTVDNDGARVSMYAAVLNVASPDILEKMTIADMSLTEFITRNVLDTCERSSLDPFIILSVTRTILNLSKLLERVQSKKIVVTVVKNLLPFVWAHIEHYMDSVRHLSAQIFENIVKLCPKEPSDDNVLLKNVINSVLGLTDNRKAYYLGLNGLCAGLGTKALLQIIPGLIEKLLNSLFNMAIVSSVTSVMDTLLNKHITEVETERIYDLWIKPILHVISTKETLTDETTVCILTTLEGIIGKALRLNPNLMSFILPHVREKCEGELRDGDMSCILVCLHVARKSGFFNHIPVTNDTNKWKDIIEYEIIKRAMVNPNEKIRILALSVLIETQKSTELFTKVELDLCLWFLRYNINTQSPNFRQQLLGLVKKLLKRWETGFTVIDREKSNMDKKHKIFLSKGIELPKGESEDHDHLKDYTDFICLLRFQMSESLFPDANFSRRCVALQVLALCENLQVPKDNLRMIWSLPMVKQLVHFLEDSYESNQILAVEILSKCPAELFNSKEFGTSLDFENILQQASSAKPTDSVAAAYKLELLLGLPDKFLKHVTASSSDRLGYTLALMRALISRLRAELAVACESVLDAAARCPMYGVLYCATHLLATVQPDEICHNNEWTDLISEYIDVVFRVNRAVAPIVNNSSPEGHLPMDFEAGSSHLEGNGVWLPDGSKVTAQMVLLCAWRSVKEVSLFLGDISSRLHIVGEHSPDGGNISEEQLCRIGEHFTTLLAETKHRGAFEQAYVGFTLLCASSIRHCISDLDIAVLNRCLFYSSVQYKLLGAVPFWALWKCRSVRLHSLPRTWLSELMQAIAGEGAAKGKLCATRRSAGVPFIIQALVTTEMQVDGNSKCFHACTQQLLHLAQFECKSETSVETRTHCLNILRALYRHTTLGDIVNPYVCDGLITAIRGFDGTTWAERNSSTLLFGSLMVRIFGVQRSKDGDKLCIRNKMTGRIFFLRYPKLYDFMLEKLGEIGKEPRQQQVLRPSLYPILLLLARLYPSSLEGTVSNLKLVAFIPHILHCANSCVLKTRQLAAKAMVPLISPERYMTHTVDMLALVRDPDTSTNYRHGILLQLTKLLEARPDNLEVDVITRNAFIDNVRKSFRLLDTFFAASPCHITANIYIDVLNSIIWRFSDICSSIDITTEVNGLLSEIFDAPPPHSYPQIGRELFLQNALTLHLALLLRSKRDVHKTVLKNLAHSDYEIVLSALNFVLMLRNNIEKDDEGCSYSPVESHLLEQISITNVNSILNQFVTNDLYLNTLLNIVVSNKYIECKQKALTLLSFEQDAPDALIRSEYANKDIDCNYIISKLIEAGEDETENLSYIYVRCLGTYVKSLSDTDLAELDGSVLLKLVQVLQECSSCEKSLRSRQLACSFVRELWVKLMTGTRLENGARSFEFICSMWLLLVTLLEDDEVVVRQSISHFVSDIYHKFVGRESDSASEVATEITENVIASRAQEVLLDCLTAFHGRDDVTAILCLVACLDFHLEQNYKDDSVDGCRVFDKGEMNTFHEETPWTNMCAAKLLSLNSDQHNSSEKSFFYDNILSSILHYHRKPSLEKFCGANFAQFVNYFAPRVSESSSIRLNKDILEVVAGRSENLNPKVSKICSQLLVSSLIGE